MTSEREDIWRELKEARDALFDLLEAAHAAPKCDFTDGDRREWQGIHQALDYSPQKSADMQST
ncbi:hypothetical protein ACQU0X_25860 [Pseudovibrio ascidiaceicola]|uniref:hypothetical protein n=1 Tax=Pseudovibrio ascidiaceicola TaxID=285279 RepID=UPI003D365668